MLPSPRLGSLPSNRSLDYVISLQTQQTDAPDPKSQRNGLARIRLIFALKMMKIVFCAVAIALIFTFSDDYRINIKCPDENDIEVQTQIEFPFRLYDLSHNTTVCNNSVELIYFENNFSVESGVFVGMAVISMLYVFCTLLVHWKKNSKPAYLIVDGLYHAILAALWLNTSFVWAVGLEHFMAELEFDNIKLINKHICQEDGKLCNLHKNIDLLYLDLSVLFGFMVAMVGVLIVSLICTQVLYNSKEDSSEWQTLEQCNLSKNDKLDGLKLIEEGDETSTSSEKDSC